MFYETAGGTATTPINVATANQLLSDYRPSQIIDFLEHYWAAGIGARSLGLVGTADEASHTGMSRGGAIPINLDAPTAPLAVSDTAEIVGWHHLVYAYMLENTRIVEIFRRVVWEYLHGERLPQATNATLRWVRNTEELFFGSGSLLSVRNTISGLRPDPGSTRRNAYYRMFGMDLNHGVENGQSYPYTKAAAANQDFVALWEQLLQEVWRGITCAAAGFNGVRETDDAAIDTLVRRLQEMLVARRLNGLISREEFDAVAMLSWFHLVVGENTRVVQDLSAQAQGSADRLKLIGERVGYSAHARSDAYFQMAQPMSVVLSLIEDGTVASANQTAPGGLYDRNHLSSLEPEMRDIITQWSIATGRDMKARKQSALPVLIDMGRVPSGRNGTGSNSSTRVASMMTFR